MRVILVHGISTDGSTNTDLLGARLSALGHQVVPVKYHPIRWWEARWRRKDVARAVLNQYRQWDAAVGHSNGALALYSAMEQGAEFSRVVLLSAAMDADTRFPCHGATRILNVFNPYDKALSWGAKIPFRHPFGTLGRDGYRGVRDDRIRDHQHAVRAGRYNHTAPYFDVEHLDATAHLVDSFLAE